jgi:ABC-type multidrug transport system permease subunit
MRDPVVVTSGQSDHFRLVDVLSLVLIMTVFCGVGIPVATAHGWWVAMSIVFPFEFALLFGVAAVRRWRRRS